MMSAALTRLERQLCAAVRAAVTGTKPQLPEAGRELWNAFQRLSLTRTLSPIGPNPIQPSEITAWCNLTCLPLEPRHAAILLAMDQAWIGAVMTKAAPDGVKTLPPISSQPLTAALLDAVMG